MLCCAQSATLETQVKKHATKTRKNTQQMQEIGNNGTVPSTWSDLHHKCVYATFNGGKTWESTVVIDEVPAGLCACVTVCNQ